MPNPFTTTFSKIPSNSYIETEESKRIIENFNNDEPSESVYKITGVRGSGKTVILSKIEENLRCNKEWIIYNLSTSRSLLNQLAAYLYKDKYIKIKSKEREIELNLKILGNQGGIRYSNKKYDYTNDVGAEIEEALKEISRKKLKIFIGIDEVIKNKDMIEFASEFGKWLISKYPVHLVCTGLYENVTKLSNVNNLTFFRRATTVKTSPLNIIRMTETYKQKLNINHVTALELATKTKGYAYAFQTLGVIYYQKEEPKSLNEIISALKTELYAYSYEKIWEELSEEDRSFIKTVINKNVSKRSDIIKALNNKSNLYSVYRDRLLKKGLISSIDCKIFFTLPYFVDYVKEYCN